MAVSVVDASALSAVVFGEPDADRVVDQLAGNALVAPSLLVYELGNTCWKKCRRHPQSVANIRKAFASLSRFDIELVDVEPMAVLELAEKQGVTFYDAAYLWLADRLQVRLVTLDRRLMR